MAKYEIRKWRYDNNKDNHEYLGEHKNFNTFAEIKNYILNNKNAHMVVFGDVFKNGEMVFSASTIFDYIDDMKLYRECKIKTKSLNLNNLIEYYNDNLAIRA